MKLLNFKTIISEENFRTVPESYIFLYYFGNCDHHNKLVCGMNIIIFHKFNTFIKNTDNKVLLT